MLAMMKNEDDPDVDERYATAINAKTLEVAQHHSGPVDVLAAAAWSESRIGAQLLRLHSEYDAGERLRSGAGKTDAVLLRQRLKSLSASQEQMTLRAIKWGMDAPEAKARAVLLWWLDHVCPRCQGLRWLVISGTPSLSGQQCPPVLRGGCGGTGERAIPYGAEGKRLAVFIEDCLSRARQSIRDRLRAIKK